MRQHTDTRAGREKFRNDNQDHTGTYTVWSAQNANVFGSSTSVWDLSSATTPSALWRTRNTIRKTAAMSGLSQSEAVTGNRGTPTCDGSSAARENNVPARPSIHCSCRG